MFKRTMALALAAGLLTSTAAVAETTLIFATASPPEGAISTQIFEEWTSRINEDGAGILQIDMRPGFTMASPTNFYDRVKDGVVPVTWGIMTMIGGRFPLTGVVELPFLTDDTEAASVAFWRLYEEGHLDEEYHDIVPLYLTAFPQSGIHLNAPLANLDNLGGASVISGSRTNSQVVERLGGTPLSISPADAYEAIQRGTADGRLVPWTAFGPFRMDEITSYHIEAPVGTAIGMVFIGRDAWEGLSEEERDVLMRNSGEDQTRRLARFFREENASTRDRMAAADGHEVISPSNEQLAAWEEMVGQVYDEWTGTAPGGGALLDRYRELLNEAAQ